MAPYNDRPTDWLVFSLQHVLDLSLYTYADLQPIQYSFDLMQSTWQCCGTTNGHSDWFAVHWTNDTDIVCGLKIGVPDSCCDPPADGADCVTTADSDNPYEAYQMTVFSHGCEHVLKSKFRCISSKHILFAAI